MIPPFPGSNRGAPATQYGLCRAISPSVRTHVISEQRKASREEKLFSRAEDVAFSCCMAFKRFPLIFNGFHFLQNSPCDMTATWNDP
jgi:hypothetical protein